MTTKIRTRHQHAPVLSNGSFKILRCLARVLCATAGQIVDYTRLNRTTVTRLLKLLVQHGYVDYHKSVKPMIAQITPMGTKFFEQITSVKPRYSMPNLMHRCHRNAIELRLRRSIPGFTFLIRKALYQRGLYPTYGEHGAIDSNNVLHFVLLDDCQMNTSRISHALNRLHSLPDKFSNIALSRWVEKADTYWLITTDERQQLLHNAFRVTEKLPVHVRYLPPIWRLL